MLAWANGCSKPEQSIISVNEIRTRIIAVVNEALDQRKEGESQSIAVRNDSNTCSITIPDSPQENKPAMVVCYDTTLSVTITLPRNGFWTIENVQFGQWRFDTQSGCITWNIRLKNGEILKMSTCDAKIST